MFTHGDFCLPNIVIHNGQVGGFIDVGRAGVGDPFRDLALCARSIAFNFGRAWVPVFFAAYGLPRPEPARLAFFRLLDEFF
ncbi:MAG: hypothetical protein NVS2B7_05120 [Herpetosiphon sp.]